MLIIEERKTQTAIELAYAEVISYNKKNLEREASEREPTTEQDKAEGGRIEGGKFNEKSSFQKILSNV